VRALADRIGANVAGFGDFVRAEATTRDVDPSRDNLQALGEQLKRELGDDEFVRRVLTSVPTDGHTVVDGIRHPEIVDTIIRWSYPAVSFSSTSM
jgi:hypothetical protein